MVGLDPFGTLGDFDMISVPKQIVAYFYKVLDDDLLPFWSGIPGYDRATLW